MLNSKLELKYAYATTSSSTVSTAGQLTRLTSIAQGIGQSARAGDEVSLKTITWRWTATVGAAGLIAAADQFNVIRAIVFRYHLDDAIAAPTVAQILNTSTSTNLTIAPLNFDNVEEYTILKDENIVLYNTPIWNGSAVTWQHGVGGTLSGSQAPISLKGKIAFSNAGVNGANHVYVLFVSDSAFAPNPLIELVSTVTYTDA